MDFLCRMKFFGSAIYKKDGVFAWPMNLKITGEFPGSILGLKPYVHLAGTRGDKKNKFFMRIVFGHHENTGFKSTIFDVVFDFHVINVELT